MTPAVPSTRWGSDSAEVALRSALFGSTSSSSSLPAPAPLGPAPLGAHPRPKKCSCFRPLFTGTEVQPHRMGGLHLEHVPCGCSLTPVKRMTETPLERDAELGCCLFFVFAFLQDPSVWAERAKSFRETSGTSQRGELWWNRHALHLCWGPAVCVLCTSALSCSRFLQKPSRLLGRKTFHQGVPMTSGFRITESQG